MSEADIGEIDYFAMELRQVLERATVAHNLSYQHVIGSLYMMIHEVTQDYFEVNDASNGEEY